MKLSKFLAISRTGTIRITSSYPRLFEREIAMQLNIEIPDALFSAPQLQAKIEIPKSAAYPSLFTAETITNIENAIKQVSKLEIKVKVVEDELKEGTDNETNEKKEI